jgi:hypothetical protein
MGANGERRNVNSNRQDRGNRVITEIALGRAELAILVFTIFDVTSLVHEWHCLNIVLRDVEL